jgi:hypothetical protein
MRGHGGTDGDQITYGAFAWERNGSGNGKVIVSGG